MTTTYDIFAIPMASNDPPVKRAEGLLFNDALVVVSDLTYEADLEPINTASCSAVHRLGAKQAWKVVYDHGQYSDLVAIVPAPVGGEV